MRITPLIGNQSAFFMLNGIQNTIADTYVKHDGN